MTNKQPDYIQMGAEIEAACIELKPALDKFRAKVTAAFNVVNLPYIPWQTEADASSVPKCTLEEYVNTHVERAARDVPRQSE